MTTILYYKCKLIKDGTFTYAWIRGEFARKGTFIDLQRTGGEWDTGWQVRLVFDNPAPTTQYPDEPVNVRVNRP